MLTLIECPHCLRDLEISAEDSTASCPYCAGSIRIDHPPSMPTTSTANPPKLGPVDGLRRQTAYPRARQVIGWLTLCGYCLAALLILGAFVGGGVVAVFLAACFLAAAVAWRVLTTLLVDACDLLVRMDARR
jgi:hypothetical protein